MMKYILSLIFFFFFFSCELNINKKISVDDILDEEWKTFNWSDVDEYPSFTTCDSLLTISQKKECFISTLSNQNYSDLISNTKIVNRTIQDTVKVNFTVSNDGKNSLIIFMVFASTGFPSSSSIADRAMV